MNCSTELITCPQIGARSARRTAENKQTQSQVRQIFEQQLSDDESEHRHEEVVREETDEQRCWSFDCLHDHICVQCTSHIDGVQADQNDDHNGKRCGQFFVFVHRNNDANSLQQCTAVRLIGSRLVQNVQLREADVLALHNEIGIVGPFADLIKLDEILVNICDLAIFDVEHQLCLAVELVQQIAEILLVALFQLNFDVGLVERRLEVDRNGGHITNEHE